MKIRIVLLAATLSVLVGCVSVGRPVDPDKLSQVNRGKSTMADVVGLLGEPQTVSEVDGPNGKRTELHYTYAYVAPDGKNFIPYYGSFAQEYHSKTQNVTIVLDSRGVVESISKNFGGESSKTGVAAETPKTTTTVQASQSTPPAPMPTQAPATPPSKTLLAAKTAQAGAIREKFNQVQVGMSQPQVASIMGEPSAKQGDIWKWCVDGVQGQAWIGFSNGRVAMITWRDSR